MKPSNVSIYTFIQHLSKIITSSSTVLSAHLGVHALEAPLKRTTFGKLFPPISLSPTIGRDGFPHLVQGWPYVAVYVEGPRSSTEHEDDLRHLWSVQVFMPAMRFHYSVRVVFRPSRVRVEQKTRPAWNTFVAPHRWKDCAAVSFLFGHVWRFCPSDAGCHDQHRPNIESKTIKMLCFWQKMPFQQPARPKLAKDRQHCRLSMFWQIRSKSQ